MYDLRPFIQEVEKIVERHFLGRPGEYARWITQDKEKSRDLGASPYGCANAVNILYTIDRLCCTPGLSAEQQLQQRLEMIRVLQGFQEESSGLFRNPGNYETHTTAFVSGALNLLDARPLYRVRDFEQYLSRESLFAFLDAIDWAENPWLGAHLGAGIYASMLLTGTGTDEWEDNYFEWLDKNADSRTGLWKAGCERKAPEFHYLAAAFHYVFNYEYARRPLPYPGALLDTCIDAYRRGACIDFSAQIGWPDIDFTYMLARVQRRAGERFREVQDILKEITDGFVGQLLKLDCRTSETLNDLNTLFAVVCALAVLQEALPGYLRTSRPLKLVLDKRPFL